MWKRQPSTAFSQAAHHALWQRQYALAECLQLPGGVLVLLHLVAQLAVVAITPRPRQALGQEAHGWNN